MPRRLLITAALVASLLPAATADATPRSSERAWVSIGDSFISGEGGRWRGNTNNPFNTSTDRAYTGFGWTGRQYAPERVYVDGTWANGCHRSDASEIINAAAGSGATPVNLACSGAETKNLMRATRDGAESFKGEKSQIDRLGAVAKDKDVDLVVVSIGGNDLQFSKIIEDCVWTSFSPNPFASCAKDEDKAVEAGMSRAMSNVRLVLEDVKDEMEDQGYDRDDYRLVLQSYPSPLPRAADASIAAIQDNFFYGCPIRPKDLTWARDTLTPKLAKNLRAAAAAEDVEFLDVQDLFDGHEVCSRHTVLQNNGGDADGEIAWMRWLNTGKIDGDAYKQESYHPNAVGQKALGRCVRRLLSEDEGRDWTCTAGRDVDPSDVRLKELKSKPARPARQRDEYVEPAEHDHPGERGELTQADVDRAAAAAQEATGNGAEGQPTQTPGSPDAAGGIDPSAAPVPAGS